MTTAKIEEEDEVILVDLQPAAGVRSVSVIGPKDIALKSQQAIDHAMQSMRGMAKKTVRAIKKTPSRSDPTRWRFPSSWKLTAEGNAVVVKGGMEAAINVKMSWTRKEE